MDFTSLALPAVGLATAHLLLARSAVMASTTIVHHFGSHGAGLDDPKASRFWAEMAGITAFKPPVQAYSDAHRRHHHPKTFATVEGDPDAKEIDRLGFKAGDSERALMLRFFWTLVAPALHGPYTLARLKHTFGADQPRWRRMVAIIFWGGLVLIALAGHWLPALMLGVVSPLMTLGNASSFVELASRHKWGWAAPESGGERHAALSHGRHPLNWLPVPGACWWRWAQLPLRLVLAVLSRLVFLGGDLPLHNAHHTGDRPQARLHRRPWANAAYEYTPSLAADPTAAANRFGGVLAAVRNWLRGLSRLSRRD